MQHERAKKPTNIKLHVNAKTDELRLLLPLVQSRRSHTELSAEKYATNASRGVSWLVTGERRTVSYSAALGTRFVAAIKCSGKAKFISE